MRCWGLFFERVFIQQICNGRGAPQDVLLFSCAFFLKRKCRARQQLPQRCPPYELRVAQAFYGNFAVVENLSGGAAVD